MIMKKRNTYHFTVEGETESWYLGWLSNVINLTASSTHKVHFDYQVQKNPLKRAKSLIVLRKTDVYHFSDYESDEPHHVHQFTETMNNMKKAMELGKQIYYKFGYSNLTFDLWMILHKVDCNCVVSHRKHYIDFINRAYDEQFIDMDDYKREANFKRCLGKLQLFNVVDAINRAKAIMQRNRDNGYTLHRYKGYEYYKENPSLNVWEVIARILEDCGLYK